MKFHELLKHYRANKNISPGELAEGLGITKEYIYNLEGGKTRKPPTLERCKEIAKFLNISQEEKKTLIDAAMFERLNDETLSWLMEREQKHLKMESIITDDIIRALEDPTAKKALLMTYKNEDDLRKIINNIIVAFQNMPKERRKELGKICSEVLTQKRIHGEKESYWGTQ